MVRTIEEILTDMERCVDLNRIGSLLKELDEFAERDNRSVFDHQVRINEIIDGFDDRMKCAFKENIRLNGFSRYDYLDYVEDQYGLRMIVLTPEEASKRRSGGKKGWFSRR